MILRNTLFSLGFLAVAAAVTLLSSCGRKSADPVKAGQECVKVSLPVFDRIQSSETARICRLSIGSASSCRIYGHRAMQGVDCSLFEEALRIQKSKGD